MVSTMAAKNHWFHEFLAARIFGLGVNRLAAAEGDIGYFKTGPLRGKTVNVEWYPKREGLLDINPPRLADYYIVLTWPKAASVSSKGGSRPWLIQSVFLFDMHKLVDELRSYEVLIGKATSVLV